jgi:hypothetical protein
MFKIMKTKLGLLMMGLGLVFTLSCSKYPPASDRLLEDLAIVTQYDTKIDFNNYKTYSITTSITKITDKDTTNLTGANVTAILDQISKNMEARGFVKAATGEKPDFGIQVLYFQNTSVYVYYYDWWGYYPYWYYYYPYYPVYYSSYTTGLADIELIDLKNVNTANNTLYMRWNAYIRGLLTGDHTQSEILNSIDQAFTQTPQLQTN